MSDVITIKKGRFEISCPREFFATAVQTPDGIIFQFKEGMALRVDDAYMPLTTKQLITSSSNIMKGNIIFDLSNYKVPARVEVG